MKTIRRPFAAILVVAFLLCSAVRGQVMDKIPAEALIVVKVSNLQGFSQKFGKLANDLQLVAQIPQLSDPLAALQEKIGIKEGLDKAGEAAFAFFDPALADGSDESIMLLIPITDYKAFVGNLKDVKVEAGVTEGKFGDSDQPAYVANWGKYAAISPRKEMIALKPTGIKTQGATAKELATKDIVMLANLAQLKSKLQPELAKGKEQVLEEIGRNMTGDSEKYVPVAKAAMSQLIG